MRPQILQHSVEYEKEKFKQFLNVQKKMNIDGLENTKIWLKRNYEAFDFEDESKEEIKIKVILNSFIELLNLDEQLQISFPETISLDQQKIKDLNSRIHVHLIVGSVILVIFASANSLSNLPDLKEKFKSIINILYTSDTGLEEKTSLEKLENIALQLIKEIQVNLKKNNLPPLDKEKELSLIQQITDLSNLENRIRSIVHRRILEFIEQALSNAINQSKETNESILKIPIGLGILKDELLEITSEFLRFISFNRSVFGEYYDKIIESFIDGSD